MIQKIHFDDTQVIVNITNPNDHIQSFWTNGNFYETGRNQLLTWCLRELPKELTYLDIGANIGNHSLFFSKVMNAKKVYSFEPYIPNYQQLVNNLSLNQIQNVVPFPLGAFSAYQLANFKCKNANNCGMVETSADGLPGAVITPDYLVDKVDFIKIDIERHEIDALIGCVEIIKSCKPIIAMETDFPESADQILKGYKREDFTLNHTPTYVWKPL